MTETAEPAALLIGFTSDIVAAHLGNNSMAVDDIPALIRTVHDTLSGLGQAKPVPAERPEPAVPVRNSVKNEYIVCLEDGRKLKLLKRYLATQYGMTPAEYRRRWNLPPDYPMVAPAYAEHRSSLAKQSGLGTRPRSQS